MSTAYTTIELIHVETNEEVVVEVEFEYSVECSEYDGPFLFAAGGVDCDETTVTPFMWGGTLRTEITADLLPHVVSYNPLTLVQQNTLMNSLDVLANETSAEEEKRAATKLVARILDNFMDETFNMSTSDVKVPAKHYRDSRYYA